MALIKGRGLQKSTVLAGAQSWGEKHSASPASCLALRTVLSPGRCTVMPVCLLAETNEQSWLKIFHQNNISVLPGDSLKIKWKN